MNVWPELRQGDWAETQATLHLWTQVVGKIRLQLEPMLNHWWNVALYVTPRGLTTANMPYGSGRSLEIAFDFVNHRLIIESSDGSSAGFALGPMTVADFYARVMAELQALRMPVRIQKKPNEVVDAIPFDHDTAHHSYDAAAAERFWRILLQVDRLSRIFRSPFIGKASPAHFFWGSFDFASSRFSGRKAPPHPGGFPNLPDSATREAYSHEEHSVGFWPGGNGMEAALYAYAYPEPPGFADSAVQPQAASWNAQLREFMLPYESVRTSTDPDGDVLAFFQSTYDAAATLASWDRAALEREPPT